MVGNTEVILTPGKSDDRKLTRMGDDEKILRSEAADLRIFSLRLGDAAGSGLFVGAGAVDGGNGDVVQAIVDGELAAMMD